MRSGAKSARPILPTIERRGVGQSETGFFRAASEGPVLAPGCTRGNLAQAPRLS